MRVAVIQIEINVVASTPPPPTSSTAAISSEGHESSAFVEVVDHSHCDLIVVLRESRNEVKVPGRSRQIRERNERQQRLRSRIEIRDHMARNRLMRSWIYELSGDRREVALTFSYGWNGREL